MLFLLNRQSRLIGKARVKLNQRSLKSGPRAS